MVSLLVRKFNAYYAARPLLTTMITNAVRHAAINPASAPQHFTNTHGRSSVELQTQSHKPSQPRA
jgi:hypothetical protein